MRQRKQSVPAAIVASENHLIKIYKLKVACTSKCLENLWERFINIIELTPNILKHIS